MKTLGLIGGTSWVSTVEYYRIINQTVNARLGGLNSAMLYLYSLNLEELKPSADPAMLNVIAETLTGIAQKLQHAGAECLVICANTPHIVAGRIQDQITIPIIHIAEVTALEIRKNNHKKVGLLGTKVTMEENFFRQKLADHEIGAIIPGEEDREFIHFSITGELGKGIFTAETRLGYLSIIEKLVSKGAEAIILGCTEIPLLIKPADCPVPVFDTTLIHATAAAEFALDGTPAV